MGHVRSTKRAAQALESDPDSIRLAVFALAAGALLASGARVPAAGVAALVLFNSDEVLPTREARAQLPAMLERFRRAGADAEPVVIGARRRPEAVVLSYERYLQLAGGRERVRAILERQAAESGSRPAPDEALELANRELHAVRRSRRRRQ